MFFSTLIGQVSSKPEGGYWNDTLTWVGHKIPTENNNVIINGSVSGGGKCNSLTISSSGELIGGNTEIFGNLINYGKVNNPEQGTITITVHGNITNHNHYDAFITYLKGESAHYFDFAESAYFSSTSLKMLDSLDIIYSKSNLSFHNSYIQPAYPQLNMGKMILQNNDNLFLNNSSLSYMNISMTGDTIDFDNDSYINQSTVDNCVLNGIININWSLTINGDFINNGILQDNIYGVSGALNINGSITNNGTVRNSIIEGYRGLSVNISGDIISSGSWINSDIKLTGNVDQNFTINGLMTGINLTTDFPETDLNILADIKMDSCQINLSDGKLNLVNNSNLILTGSNDSYSEGYFYSSTINANNNDITFKNRGFLSSEMIINNANLKGIINIGGNVEFTGNTILTDTLQAYDKITSGKTISFDGPFTNNGVIKENVNSRLSISTSSDIINNGVWDTYTLTFEQGANSVECQNGAIFQTVTFQTSETDTLIANSDINIANARIYFKNGLFAGNGYNLKMIGNEYNHYLSDITLSDFILKGNIQVTGNQVKFKGTTTLTDTMRVANSGIGATIYLADDFINNGLIIKNGSTGIGFHTTGTITNNGKWESSSIYFDQGAKSVRCLNENYFETGYFYTNEKDTIEATDDVNFVNTTVDFKEGLFIGNGYNFNQSGSGYYITRNTTLSNFSLKGNIVGSNKLILSNVTVSDTLSGTNTTTIYDNFTNNGFVMNNKTSYHRIELFGDVINNGVWNNYALYIKGSENQAIYFPEDKPIICQTRLYSDIGSTYQWLKNDIEMENKTSQYVTFDSLNSNYYGNYYCETNEGNSRTTQIYGGTKSDFVTENREGYAPLIVNFTNNSQGAINNYKWYFGDGDSSDVKNPEHTYILSGLYDVTLIVNDGIECDTLVKTGYINVLEYIEPVADFSADTTSGDIPLTVSFNDNSQGLITAYKWFFGDGDSSNVQNPIHDYSITGSWDVTLIVTDDIKSDTLTKVGYILSGTVSVESEQLIPEKFQVHPCYPNPFNSTTNIRFDLPESGLVKINIYNINGKLISTLNNSIMSAGYKQITWNTQNYSGSNLSSGIYIIKIEMNTNNAITKVLFVK